MGRRMPFDNYFAFDLCSASHEKISYLCVFFPSHDAFISGDEKQATFTGGDGSRLASRLRNGKRNHNLRQHHQPQYRGGTLMEDKIEVTIKGANEQRSQVKNSSDQEGAKLEVDRVEN